MKLTRITQTLTLALIAAAAGLKAQTPSTPFNEGVYLSVNPVDPVAVAGKLGQLGWNHPVTTRKGYQVLVRANDETVTAFRITIYYDLGGKPRTRTSLVQRQWGADFTSETFWIGDQSGPETKVRRITVEPIKPTAIFESEEF